MSEEVVTTIEGPNGTADILEIMLPRDGSDVVEIEYVVASGNQRTEFRSLGEAHVFANRLTGAKDEDQAAPG